MARGQHDIPAGAKAGGQSSSLVDLFFGSVRADLDSVSVSESARWVANFCDHLVSASATVEGPLTRSLASNPTRPLAESLSILPEDYKKKLEDFLGPAGLKEILTLSGEKDPQLFYEQLQVLAGRMTASGKFEVSALLREAVLRS